MLSAHEVTRVVGGKALIDRVSASFERSQLSLVIGPNGAGKSTLIKLLSKQLRADAGTIAYDSTNVRAITERELAKIRAVLSQSVELSFPLRVWEVVMMGRYPHFGGRPGPADEEIVDQLMTFFDVTEFADRDYQTLSGGERQRVNFARVLGQLWRTGHEPAPTNADAAKTGCRFLFLDEPLTFLDIRHQIDFMKKVRKFSDAPDVVTVGVVHDLNLAARFADQVVLLNEGEVVATGAPSNVLTQQNIRNVFAVEPTFVSIDQSNVHIVFD